MQEEKKDAGVYKQIYPIGTKFTKVFGARGYEGEVESFDEHDGWYHVLYEDGDQEDLPEEELKQLLESPPKAAKRKKKQSTRLSIEDDDSDDDSPPPKKKKNKTGSKRKKAEAKRKRKKDETSPIESEAPSPDEQATEGTRSLRARKAVDYSLNHDEHEFTDSHDEESEEEEKVVKPKATKSKARGKPKPDDSDDESASFSEASSSSEEEDFDSDSDVEEKKPAAKKKGEKKSARAAAKAGSSTTKKQGGKKMYDSFEPLNAPHYCSLSREEIREQKEFLDPCGMECSDEIVERLVGEQVDKVGGLLKRAWENNDYGSEGNPLQLGTACSGTDAPALALTIVQEQLEQRGLADLFRQTHQFSCEVEPFKQGYLERNFDSTLYPDITKLSDDTPLDVYGQQKPIPPFNMIVAGTSCKNFSMLRSKRRIDIEDKGCSGETFLAAVELLIKEKPKMAIFENVTNAPWMKMQEYIRGRVKLSECASTKAIKENKDKNKDLTFALDDDKIVVDFVPAVYGIRAGAVVAGFLRPGEKELNEITMKGKTCTLTALMKENGISKAKDTLVFETSCTYCTEIIKVDTKAFGLPQNRERIYMFVWQPDDGDVDDDLGQYWKEVVRFLQSPLRHSLPSFILQDDHDIIRVFREALRGPPGRQTARGVTQEPDFWTSASANLPHNKTIRKKIGMEDRARFLTNWEAYGKKQVPPHFWLEYVKCIDQRRTDLLDILYASALRDAEAHDSNFASFYWNTSQNASKEKHRYATAGIAGCITPGGDFVIPSQGRALLGCEKLMIQGIPYFRLALGNETEVQLGDLAGNAMSLTVVCATMLAAISCRQLRRETLESKHKDARSVLEKTALLEGFEKYTSWTRMVATQEARCSSPVPMMLTPATTLFRELASLAPAAVKSSIWCTCETSGSNSLSGQFLQCRVCRVSCCRNCISATVGYNLTTHDTVDVEISEEDHGLIGFQSQLRQIVPPTLVFGKKGIDEIAGLNGDEHRVTGLSNYVFCLHRIKRDRRKWLIIYYARDNHGIGEAVAEFRISVGELRCEEVASCEKKIVDIGMRGELTSYFPSRTTPLVYGPLDACAMVTVHHQGSKDVEWKARAEDTVISSMRLEGEGRTDSPRVEAGLTDVASESLCAASKTNRKAKHFKTAKERGEERRWLFPKLWKTWPEKIHLEAQGEANRLAGTYERAPCRQTTNQSALWIRKESEENDKEPSLYILIRPNVTRVGPDVAVVSESASHEDTSSILAVLPEDWQPSDALDAEYQDVSNACLKNWEPITMECSIPSTEIRVRSPQDPLEVLLEVSGLSPTDVALLCRNNTTKENRVRLGVSTGQKAQQTIRVFNSLCVSPILQRAAQSGLKYDITPDAPWTPIAPSDPAVPFGCCTTTVPVRPKENWYYDNERSIWDRRAEPGASRRYYLQLESAPQPFQMWLDKNAGALSVECYPEVLAHRAAGQLIGGRGGNMQDEVAVNFRLLDLAQQRDPVISPFKVSNCDDETALFVELKGDHKLYERQQKVVSKMVAIEDSKTTFNEIEMSEQEMPGSTGLSLIAKASRDRKLSGGVIADAIGSGKTVISIAMIVKGLAKARKSRAFPNQSGASLVVVPPGLIDQWASEIEKFSTGIVVVKIYDFKGLQDFSVKDIVEADVVIVPVNILESKGYLECVVKKAGLNIGDVSDLKLPRCAGQRETLGALGVWIPATSTDPYAGGNSPLNQKRRNQSAYYTHTYLSSVYALRDKDFGPSQKGVPLEFFEWERIFVDEIHESLCTTKAEVDAKSIFKEKNRRVGRELLGLTQKDIRRRPLLFRKAIYGLTGTPLLDSSSRVIELANLMGGTYLVGMSSHWRKLERESCRDIFLHNYLEPKQSREVRQSVYAKCQEYLTTACCRNKTGEEMDGIELVHHHCVVSMTEEQGKLYLESQKGISSDKRSFDIKPGDFDVTAGHDISTFLMQNAKLECRGTELIRIVKSILARKGDEHTKIIVFADGSIGAGLAARRALDKSGLGCTYLDINDSVETKNKKIAWYQRGDATNEDKQRPRVLVLHFEHAAGLNLQTECHDMILFSPLYIGEGGATSDAVSDASTEQQAIGRVFRPGQRSLVVNLFRIEVRGPNDEECLDGQLIRRNTDKETIAMAINAGDE